MSNKNEIVYPKFLTCCKYTNDLYWKNVFEELSYGITPYGIYINKDFICCNFKNKEFSYKIDLNKESNVLFTEIYDIFKNKFGLLSLKEKVAKRKHFDEFNENLTNNKKVWSNIRKKNLKQGIVEKFVIKQKKHFNLTLRQTKCILPVISICLMFKVINNNDIIYEDSQIKEIKGIRFEDKSIYIDKDIYSKISELNTNTKEDKIFLKNWEKMIKTLDLKS